MQSLSIYNCPNLDIISCSHNYLNISQDVNTDNPEKVKDSYLYVYPQNIILRQQVREGDIFDISGVDSSIPNGLVQFLRTGDDMMEKTKR